MPTPIDYQHESGCGLTPSPPQMCSGLIPNTSRDANERMLSATRALCNECGDLVEAQIVERSEKVWLVKWCKCHGRTEALVSSDATWYRQSLGYVKTATPTKARHYSNRANCPTQCGLCAGHEQHTCLPILEITEACDLACPICLVDAGHKRHRSLSEIANMVDELVRCEGHFNMLTLSGGEPTLHPEFFDILDLLDRPEIGVVSLSTNGMNIAKDDELIRCLKDHDTVVSLQFDGLMAQTREKLRGDAGQAEIKRRALDRLLSAGIRVSLTTTLAKEHNEHELAGILKLLFAEDRIVSLMIQPLSLSQRARRRGFDDATSCLTTPDVVKLLANSSGGVLAENDFTPLPCSHPSCFTLTYLLKTLDGHHVPLSRVLPWDVYLDTIKNQALLNTDHESLQRAQDALYELWSSSGIVPNRDSVLKTVRQLLVDLNALGKKPSHREVLSVGVDRIKSIFIHHFMDRYNFDLSRVMRCCNHYPMADGRLIPACVRNNLGS